MRDTMKFLNFSAAFQNQSYGDFEKQLFLENLQRAKLLSKVIIIFELIIISLNLTFKILNDVSIFTFDYYLLLYVLYIILCLGLRLLIYQFEKGNMEDHARYARYRIGFSAMISLALIWGVGITLRDQINYGSLIVFLVNTMSMSVLIHASSRTILRIYAVPCILLLVGLPFFQSSSAVLIGNYINLPVFLFFCWLTSRMLYQRNYRNYRNELLLKEMNESLALKVKENEKINQELKQANKYLEELTVIDELTKIPNRRGFQQFIQKTMDARSDHQLVSILMIDIDAFKQFNDYYGHPEGDKILKSVAQKMSELIDPSISYLARYGGEEFVVATFGAEEMRIYHLAESIRLSIEQMQLRSEPSPFSDYVTISIGVSTEVLEDPFEIERLMEKADKALYQAKTSGRNQVAAFREMSLVEH